MKKKSILAIMLSFVLLFGCFGMFGCDVKVTPDPSNAVFMFKNGESVKSLKIDVTKFTDKSTIYDVIKSSEYASTINADVAEGDMPYLNAIYGMTPDPDKYEFVAFYLTLEQYKWNDVIKTVENINFYSSGKGIGEVLLVKDATYLFNIECYDEQKKELDSIKAVSNKEFDSYIKENIKSENYRPTEQKLLEIAISKSAKSIANSKSIFEVAAALSNSKNTVDALKTDEQLAKTDAAQPKEVSSAWSNFRGDELNSGITSASTPTDQNAELKWATKVASGWSDSPSVQIIVGDSLIVVAGKTIRKYNLSTGAELKRADMVDAMSFGIVPPTYGGGMIFVPLAGGKIQAFNATTLKSLWVYTDVLGGQGLSQITYSDGFIYTGFWYSETRETNFVCLQTRDDVPNSQVEDKKATWSFTNAGGFYWVGAVVVGDAVIVGADNGVADKSSASHLYSFDRLSGEIISDIAINGDQRSAIVYQKETNRIYFTTKCGNLYYATVNAATGEISNLVVKNYELESTSTPVVYNGRLYIGIGSLNGEKNQILVLDANTLEIIYKADVKGYPQCSLLLSTAYLGADNTVYLYSTYNAKPGGITLLKDKPGQTAPEMYEIFTPEAAQSNYCICSIIAGEDGTLYYKNDSGHVFAIR